MFYISCSWCANLLLLVVILALPEVDNTADCEEILFFSHSFLMHLPRLYLYLSYLCKILREFSSGGGAPYCGYGGFGEAVRAWLRISGGGGRVEGQGANVSAQNEAAYNQTSAHLAVTSGWQDCR